MRFEVRFWHTISKIIEFIEKVYWILFIGWCCNLNDIRWMYWYESQRSIECAAGLINEDHTDGWPGRCVLLMAIFTGEMMYRLCTTECVLQTMFTNLSTRLSSTLAMLTRRISERHLDIKSVFKFSKSSSWTSLLSDQRCHLLVSQFFKAKFFFLNLAKNF